MSVLNFFFNEMDVGAEALGLRMTTPPYVTVAVGMEQPCPFQASPNFPNIHLPTNFSVDLLLISHCLF